MYYHLLHNAGIIMPRFSSYLILVLTNKRMFNVLRETLANTQNK